MDTYVLNGRDAGAALLSEAAGVALTAWVVIGPAVLLQLEAFVRVALIPLADGKVGDRAIKDEVSEVRAVFADKSTATLYI
jgi:hypothetical protein